MNNNPLLAIKAKQIADAEAAGELHPYHPDYVRPRSEGAAIDQSNLLHMIKASQIEEAEKTGINPYEPSGAPSASATDIHRGLDHYQAAMDADLAQLAQLKDIVEKAKAKQTMIETYWGFVKAYVDNGDNYPNDIAVRVMIWLFDTLDIERGLDLAFYLIKQGIHQTPSKFDRDLQTFVCDATYDWAAALLKLEQPQSASPYLDTLVAHIDNDAWLLAPPVQSKMYALLAKHKRRENQWGPCLALCIKAEAVNPGGAGVKGMKAEAEAKFKPETQTPPAPPAENSELGNDKNGTGEGESNPGAQDQSETSTDKTDE